MTMRASSDPRRVYTRAGQLLVCFEGSYFGSGTKSNINSDKEVKCEAIAGKGKARIRVTQGKTHETWGETKVEVQHRASA